VLPVQGVNSFPGRVMRRGAVWQRGVTPFLVDIPSDPGKLSAIGNVSRHEDPGR